MPAGISSCLAALVLLLAACGGNSSTPTPPPAPVELISNLGGSENADVSFSAVQGRVVAVGFRMPNQNYQLASMKLKLRGYTTATIGTLVVQLYGNSTANQPEGLLSTFTKPASVPNDGLPDLLTFTSPTALALAANATYWVVAYDTGPDSPGWTSGNPSTIPVGLASHVGARFDLFVLPNPPTSSITDIGAYAVYGFPK